MAEDVPGPPGAEDDGRIPRGMALPRLSPDAVLEVKPRKRGLAPAPATDVLVLDLPEPPAPVPTPVPRQRRWLRGTVIGAAVAAVAVVLGLGLVIPGLMNGDTNETSSLPAPSANLIPPVKDDATPTPTRTGKAKPTKKPATHTPTKTKTATTAKAIVTKSKPPTKGGSQPSSTPSTTTTTPKQIWGTTVVPPSAMLKVGENWHTNRIKLTLTTAGDAVLTDENGKVTWRAGQSGGTALAFQGDGNLVLYGGNDVLWATQTVGHEGAKLVLQDDGNVTISLGNDLLWSAL